MPPKSPIRLALFSATFLLLASCSKAPDPAMDAQREGESSGPAIAPTAAPGVAFNYSYAFRLPARRIAAVQEAHAQACEQLGIAKCRITGLRYKVVGEGAIDAMLSFKLAPEIARQFGKTGVLTVQKAEGMVVDTEISGTDVSGAIATARRNGGEIVQQIATLEAELKQPKVSADRRADLLARIDELRATGRANAENRDQKEDALANTPMTFIYGSGELVPGFDARSPIRDASQTAANILLGMLYILIVGAAFLVPLMLALGIVLNLARRFRPLWLKLTRAPVQSD